MRRPLARSLGVHPIRFPLAVALVVPLLLAACGQGASPTPPLPSVTLLGQAVPQDMVSRGLKVYQTYCQACHGDRNGRGARQGVSPHNQDGHTWHHPDHHLLAWTIDGRVPMGMPAFRGQLGSEEVIAVLALIKTWWTEEQRLTQTDLTLRYQEALERAR